MVTDADLKNMQKAFDALQRNFNKLQQEFDEMDTRCAALVDGQNALRADIEAMKR